MIRLKTEYAQTKENLKREVGKILGSRMRSINPVYERLRQTLITDVVAQKSLQARIMGYERVLRDLEQKITRFPGLDTGLAELKRQVSNFEQALNKLKQSLEEMKLQEIRELRTFEVLDQATAPKRAFFPNFLINSVVALLLALFVGVFYAFVVEYFTKKGGEMDRATAPPEKQDSMDESLAKTLLSKGLLTAEEVFEIHKIQKTNPALRFGEIAVKLGYVTHDQLEEVANIQGHSLSELEALQGKHSQR